MHMDGAERLSRPRTPRNKPWRALIMLLLASPVSLLLGWTLLAPPAHAETHSVSVAGARLDIELDPSDFELPVEVWIDWVRTSARAVESYYGRFPVDHVTIRLRSYPGYGLNGGSAEGWRGAVITINAGRYADRDDLRADWMMVHEMVHLAFPNVADRHHWIEEGLATYVEPFARLEIGELSPQKVWGDLVDGLPHGLPRLGDRGLDNTPTWGRTYWGGALFALRADIEIRERTQNRKGLRDALRAIVAQTNMLTHWPLEKALRVGDEAVGVPVLTELYARMKDSPDPVDLPALWSQLGVVTRTDLIVKFADDAPKAAIRRAISSGPRDSATGSTVGE